MAPAIIAKGEFWTEVQREELSDGSHAYNLWLRPSGTNDDAQTIVFGCLNENHARDLMIAIEQCAFCIDVS